MGTLASPNLVLPLIDLATGALDTGETVVIVLHGDAYPGDGISVPEIGATGYYKIETAGGVAALAQGIYEVYVNGTFKAVFVHGHTALQDHADSVADPHSLAAAQVSIVDAGGYFTGTDVEAAMQELGDDVAALSVSNAILLDNSAQSVDVAKPVITNLNADKIDGRHAGASAGNVPILDAGGDLPLDNIPDTLTGKDADSVDGRDVGIVNGTIPELGSGAGQLDTSVLGKAVGTSDDKIPQISDSKVAGKLDDTLLGVELGTVLGSDIPTVAQARNRTATLNQGDVPSPATYGGGTVWAEASIPNNLTPIILDDSIDWRDRFIIINGIIDERGAGVAGFLPGGINDIGIRTTIIDLAPQSDLVVGMFYSEEGAAAAGVAPRFEWNSAAVSEDYVFIWADSTTGKLMIGKDSITYSSQYAVFLKIDYSPDQGHY